MSLKSFRTVKFLFCRSFRALMLFQILLLLCGTALLCACAPDESESSETLSGNASVTPGGSESAAESVSLPDGPIDYGFRADLSEYFPYLNPAGGMLLLANKQVILGSEYAPAVRTLLDPSLCMGGKEIELEDCTAKALSAMLTEMHAQGITDVFATSGYRSYARQEYLFNYYCQDEAAKHPGWSAEQVRQEVLTYSAAPGTSEHQTGLCADLITSQMSGLYNYASEYGGKVGFAETRAFEWLKDNAYKFGFILRYPADKVSVTGYAYESWHYRFVGQNAAKIIHDNHLTLEEYLADHRSESP